jgi:hypothetical protein
MPPHPPRARRQRHVLQLADDVGTRDELEILTLEAAGADKVRVGVRVPVRSLGDVGPGRAHRGGQAGLGPACSHRRRCPLCLLPPLALQC